MKSYKVESVIDFAEILNKEDEIITASIDQDGVNTLIIHSAPKYRTENGMFAVNKSEKPKDYTFIRHDFEGNKLLDVTIKDEYYNFNNANFLPSKEILLICSRSNYVSETETEKNARIYNLNGNLSREFFAGDGIQDVKIDLLGNIWTSYFDEGIFGNLGSDTPIASYGLICWDKNGEKIWGFEPIEELDNIWDCYAMNIDSGNSTWFYYYTEFPLVKITNLKQIEFWETNVQGSISINICDDKILMSDGYDDTNFLLFEINGGKLKKSKKIKFKSTDGTDLNKRNYISSFGSRIGFLESNKIYFTDIQEII